MTKVLIGTGNQAKVNTYKELLKEFEFEVVSAKDLNIPEPEETGKTFEDNAILKAKYYLQKSGIPSLVDDGGMQIEALNNEPGINSKRWIGRDMTDEEIIAEVMKRMKGIPEGKRACDFTVVLALATPFGTFTSDSAVVGVIGDKPSLKLTKGYPYDSVMYLPNYGKYVCELPDSEYEIMNVRKHAFEKIKHLFKELSKD
jgi:XTP/dITP diphosphohydrolase